MYRYWMILYIVLQQCNSLVGAGCRLSVIANETIQYLRPPGYGNQPESRQKQCYWVITTAENKRVRITIRYILKSTPAGCFTAKTDIYDGTMGVKKHQLGRWCGEEASTFTSQWNEMLVRAYGVDKIPLEVSYQSFSYSPCSRSLTISDSGEYTIISAGYPDTTERDTECTWSINAEDSFARNKTLHLNFINIDIPDSTFCGADFIRVHAYTLTRNTRLVTMCGQMGETYEYFIESLLIVYRSGLQNHTGMGFKLKIQAKESSCSSTHKAMYREQVLTSLNYPDPFKSFQRCSFLIESTYKKMNVWMETTDMSFGTYVSQCSLEHLLVYDGHTENGQLLGKLCGGGARQQFKTVYRSLLLVFITRDNTEIQKHGFRLVYKQEVCGKTIGTGAQETFSFPGFLEPFTESVECVWTVMALQRIIIHIYDMNVECQANTFTVYDGSVNRETRWEICNKKNVMYLSSGTSMQVKLVAHGRSTTYFTIKGLKYDDQACGPSKGYLSAEEDMKTLTSPGYPFRYPDDVTCIWQIKAWNLDSMVRVTFKTFFDEKSENCPDYIDVFEGPVSIYNDPEFRICETEQRYYQSKSQYVTFLFYSDESNGAKGFIVEYTSIQGPGEADQEHVVDPNNNAVIIGAVSGLAVFILVIIIAVVVVRVVQKRRASQTPRASNLPEPSTRDATSPFLLVSGSDQPSSPVPSAPPATWASTSDPPPSYQDIPAPQSTPQPLVVPVSPPPSYEDAVTKGMIQHTVL